MDEYLKAKREKKDIKEDKVIDNILSDTLSRKIKKIIIILEDKN